MAADILVIDDEADISSLISDILTDEKYAVRTANNSDRALKALAERVPSALANPTTTRILGIGCLAFVGLYVVGSLLHFKPLTIRNSGDPDWWLKQLVEREPCRKQQTLRIRGPIAAALRRLERHRLQPASVRRAAPVSD